MGEVGPRLKIANPLTFRRSRPADPHLQFLHDHRLDKHLAVERTHPPMGNSCRPPSKWVWVAPNIASAKEDLGRRKVDGRKVFFTGVDRRFSFSSTRRYASWHFPFPPRSCVKLLYLRESLPSGLIKGHPCARSAWRCKLLCISKSGHLQGPHNKESQREL